MQKVLIKLKKQLKGAGLDLNAPQTKLSSDEFLQIRALMQVLADSEQKLSDDYLEREVTYICENRPGLANEFRRGVELIQFQATNCLVTHLARFR